LFSREVGGVDFSKFVQEVVTFIGLVVGLKRRLVFGRSRGKSYKVGLVDVGVSGLAVGNFVDPSEDVVRSIVSSLGLKLSY